ncbi:MAG: UbiD family decarboxylase [Thermodesulfobacteriota bacterium]|nr:UbiD family decarboxylase [Thermodesulfobacteriota bacterium]
MAFKDLRDFLELLKEKGELVTIDAQVDPHLEIGAVGHLTRMGPAVLFTNVKGSDKSVAINVVGTRKRVALALDTTEEGLMEKLSMGIDNPIKPVLISNGPCKENILMGDEIDLNIFPIPKWNDKDGGRFSDFGIVITKDVDTGTQNAGMYRMHVKGKNKTSIFVGERQHIGRHYQKAKEKGLKALEMAVAIGLDPITNLMGPCPAEYGVNEIDLAGGLRGEPVEIVKCETVDLVVPATSEIVLEGKVPLGVHETEGPFGEFTGYYSGTYEHPVFEISAITHRNNPVFQGTYLGKPPTEGHIAGEIAMEHLTFKEAKTKVPELTGVHIVEGTGWIIFCASIKKEYEGQIHKVSHAIWSTEIGDYGKILIIVDDDINPYNIHDVIWAMSTRYQPEFDTYITPRVAGYGIDPSERSIKPRGIETGGISSLTSRILIDATVSIERPIMGEPVSAPLITDEVKKRLGDLIFPGIK